MLITREMWPLYGFTAVQADSRSRCVSKCGLCTALRQGSTSRLSLCVNLCTCEKQTFVPKILCHPVEQAGELGMLITREMWPLYGFAVQTDSRSRCVSTCACVKMYCTKNTMPPSGRQGELGMLITREMWPLYGFTAVQTDSR